MRCDRLKELQYGQLAPQVIGGEESWMVDYVKLVYAHEPGLLIIDDLREISIVKQELLNLDSKLSL